MAEPQSKIDGDQKDGLALIVGGLFVLALVFATYNYFNSKPNETKESSKEELVTESEPSKEETKTLADKLKDVLNPQDKEEKTGDVNGDAATTTKETNENSTATTDKAIGTGGEGAWMPTDYQKGDITGKSYTVQAGDTLWEIAEARYGSGADWVKILQANSAQVGYLPNGQQALIFAGQTLVLP